MSKISESLFPALYRTLVAKPGQMQLFSPRAQPADEPVFGPIYRPDLANCIGCGAPDHYLCFCEKPELDDDAEIPF
tara:strand:+ start:580 stop:807 length:228 start_codon:yes stop_codon:yes gene_type:complete